MKKSILAIAAGAAAFATASAFADHHEKKMDVDWDAKMKAHFEEMDANGDGNISGDEYLAYKRAEAEEHWAEMAEGAGDDGMVSYEEMKAMHKAKMEKKKEKMKEHGEH